MTKENNCAGSYPVSGYTRADGTKVSGYIRTCGAAHASTESTTGYTSADSEISKKEQIISKEETEREKMQRRADILYPTMSDNLEEIEGLTGGAVPVKNDEFQQEDVTSKTVNTTNWTMPCEGRISSDYGKRKSPTIGASSEHKGVDIVVPIGTSVRAIADGKVIAVGPAKGYGLWVKLDHGVINGTNVTSEYGHISKGSVSVGQKVKQGDEIAKSGNTGIGTGPHLHLTIKENGVHQSPWKYINK